MMYSAANATVIPRMFSTPESGVPIFLFLNMPISIALYYFTYSIGKSFGPHLVWHTLKAVNLRTRKISEPLLCQTSKLLSFSALPE